MYSCTINVNLMLIYIELSNYPFLTYERYTEPNNLDFCYRFTSMEHNITRQYRGIFRTQKNFCHGVLSRK